MIHKLRNRKKTKKILKRMTKCLDSQSSRLVWLRHLTDQLKPPRPLCKSMPFCWKPIFGRCYYFKKRLGQVPLDHYHTRIVSWTEKPERAEDDGPSCQKVCRWHIWAFCCTCNSWGENTKKKLRKRRRDHAKRQARLRVAKLEAKASAQMNYNGRCGSCFGSGEKNYTTVTFPVPQFVERDERFPDVLLPQMSHARLAQGRQSGIVDTNRELTFRARKHEWIKNKKTHYVFKRPPRQNPQTLDRDRSEKYTPTVYRRSKLRFVHYRPHDLWSRRNQSRLCEALTGELRIRAGIPTYRRCEYIPAQISWAKKHSEREETCVLVLDLFVRTIGPFRPDTAEGVRNQEIMKDSTISSGILDALIALLEDECGDDYIHTTKPRRAYNNAASRIKALRRISRVGAEDYGFYTAARSAKQGSEPACMVCRMLEWESFPPDYCWKPVREKCGFDPRCLRITDDGTNRCAKDIADWCMVQMDELVMCILRGLTISHTLYDAHTGASPTRCHMISEYFCKYPLAVEKVEYYTYARGSAGSKSSDKSYRVDKGYHDVNNVLYFHRDDIVTLLSETQVDSEFPSRKRSELIRVTQSHSGREGEIPESHLRKLKEKATKTPRERIQSKQTGYSYRFAPSRVFCGAGDIVDKKENPARRPRYGAPTSTDKVRFWSNMLMYGSEEFKTMMNQHHRSICESVIKYWWQDYIENSVSLRSGESANEHSLRQLEFGLRNLGELFKRNVHVADLSNKYHMISIQGVGGGDDSTDILVGDVSKSADHKDTGQTQQRDILTFIPDAATKVYGGVKVTHLFVRFYSQLAEGADRCPNGMQLRRKLESMRNLASVIADEATGYHGTVGQLLVTYDQYDQENDETKTQMHDLTGQRINDLVHVIPKTAKLYETTIPQTVDDVIVFGEEPFRAATKGLRPENTRAELFKHSALDVAFRFLHTIYQNEASANWAAGHGGQMRIQRLRDTQAAFTFIASAVTMIHDRIKSEGNSSTDALPFFSTASILEALHMLSSGVVSSDKTAAETVEKTDSKQTVGAAKELIKRAKIFDCGFIRWICRRENEVLMKQKSMLKKAKMEKKERMDRRRILDKKLLNVATRKKLEPDDIRFIRELGVMPIEKILDHFISETDHDEIRTEAIISKILLWSQRPSAENEGTCAWSILPGIGRCVYDAQNKRRFRDIRYWVYDDPGRILRELSFAEKQLRLVYDNCPAFRSPLARANFPSNQDLDGVRAVVWKAIKDASDKKVNAFGALGDPAGKNLWAFQIECFAREDIGELETMRVDVYVRFPAVESSSAGIRITAKHVGDVKKELEKIVNEQSSPGSIWAFQSLFPPKVAMESLSVNSVDTLIVGPTDYVNSKGRKNAKASWESTLRKRQDDDGPRDHYITREDQIGAASFIAKQWRDRKQRQAGSVLRHLDDLQNARILQERVQKDFNGAPSFDRIGCLRLCAVMEELLHDDIELLPKAQPWPPPPPDTDSTKQHTHKYRHLRSNEYVRQEKQLKREPISSALRKIGVPSTDEAIPPILQYVDRLQEKLETGQGELNAPNSLESPQKSEHDPLSVLYRPCGVTGGKSAVDQKIKRRKEYWESMTRTEVHRGRPGAQNMFTIIQDLMLEQAAVEALRYLHVDRARGNICKRSSKVCRATIVGGACTDKVASCAGGDDVCQSFESLDPESYVHRNVQCAKDSPIYEKCAERITNYLSATNLASPLMLWCLAAEIPSDDPLYDKQDGSLSTGGKQDGNTTHDNYSAELLIEHSVQNDGNALETLTKEDRKNWIEGRKGKKYDVTYFKKDKNPAQIISARAQYAYGVTDTQSYHSERKDCIPDWVSSKDKKKMRDEGGRYRRRVDSFAHGWWKCKSYVREMPKRQRLAPFEEWCPWDVTATLDKYIQKKALKLMHEAYNKCGDLYSIFLDQNRDGIFVCPRHLQNNCVAEEEIMDIELSKSESAFAKVFTVVPKVEAPNKLYVYNGSWIDNANFVNAGQKIVGFIKWQARGQEQGFKDPTLGGTVWERKYGMIEPSPLWIRHPKSERHKVYNKNVDDFDEDIQWPLTHRDFRLLIPMNAPNVPSKLKQAMKSALVAANLGDRARPTGIIFRATFIRSTQEDLVREALLDNGKPLDKNTPWDANQKEYQNDARSTDKIELKFEKVYQVVRQFHAESFEELSYPYPRCTACWLETGKEKDAYYFSRLGSTDKHTLGVLNPAFKVFYTNPVRAFKEFVLPAILNNPSKRRAEKLILTDKARKCANWGAFGCGELCNPYMDTRNLKNSASKKEGSNLTKKAVREESRRSAEKSECNCQGMLHKCEKFQLAVSLVRYITSCPEYRIRIHQDVIQPVSFLEKDKKYYWSVSDGTDRKTVHAMLRMYELMTAARTCKFVIPVSSGLDLLDDKLAMFLFQIALDRRTFSKSDQGTITPEDMPVVMAINLAKQGDEEKNSDIVNEPYLKKVKRSLKGNLWKVYSQGQRSEIDKAIWFECSISFDARETFPFYKQSGNAIEKERRKWCTQPHVRHKNEYSYKVFRKWSKSKRKLVLKRPDMFNPVKVAIDPSKDLPEFHHAPTAKNIYRQDWSKIDRIRDRHGKDSCRRYLLRFLCPQITGRIHTMKSTNRWEGLHYDPSKREIDIDTEGIDFVIDGKRVRSGDCIKLELTELEKKDDESPDDYFVTKKMATGQWKLRKIDSIRDGITILECIKRLFGRMQKMNKAILNRWNCFSCRVIPWPIRDDDDYDDTIEDDIAALEVYLDVVDDLRDLDDQRREREDLHYIQEELCIKFKGHEDKTMPYDDPYNEATHWKVPESDSHEVKVPHNEYDKFLKWSKSALCESLVVTRGRTFQLKSGETEFRVLSQLMIPGDTILCISNDSVPHIWKFTRIHPPNAPGEAATVEMEEVGEVKPIPDGAKGAKSGDRRHGFVTGGSNEFRDNFVCIEEERENSSVRVKLMPRHEVDVQWTKWRDRIVDVVQEINNRQKEFDYTGTDVDVRRPVIDGSPLIEVHCRVAVMKGIKNNRPSCRAEELFMEIKEELCGPSSDTKLEDCVVMDVIDGKFNPFANKPDLIQDVVWKPLIEAAFVVRGLGLLVDSGVKDIQTDDKESVVRMEIPIE